MNEWWLVTSKPHFYFHVVAPQNLTSWFNAKLLFQRATFFTITYTQFGWNTEQAASIKN